MIMDENSWPDLNCDILECIIHKLDIADVFRFSATCRSWHSLIQMHFRHCLMCPRTLFPWLLFSFYGDLIYKRIKHHLNFYDIASSKWYNVPVDGILDNLIGVIGSSNGFLVVVDSAYDIHIINPMTKAHYPLPRSCLTILCHFKRMGQLSYHNFYHTRAVIDICPSSNHSFSVALLLDNLAIFANFGDAEWSLLGHAIILDLPDGGHDDGYGLVVARHIIEDIVDAIFHKGELHVVCESGTFVFDLKTHSETPTNLHFNHARWKYLVKSPNGNDLFLVSRKFEYVEYEERLRCVTKGFEVYKFDETLIRWDKVEDKGEFALFVGPNPFFFLPTTKCSRNNIYFINEWDYDEWNHDGIGELDLVDGSIKWFDLDLELEDFRNSFWFTPTPV